MSRQLSIVVVLLLVPWACHRTEREAPADAVAPTTTASAAAPSVSASAPRVALSAAPARWKSLAPALTLKNTPASWSSITVLDDVVTVVGYDAEARVYEVGSDTPKATLARTEWSSRVGGVQNGLLLVADVKKVSAYDARTLKKRWTTPLPTLSSAMTFVSGPGYVALLASFESGGAIYGLDAATGAVRWQKPFSFQAKMAASGPLVVAYYNYETLCLDGMTGAVKWERRKDWDHDLAMADPSRLVFGSPKAIVLRAPLSGADSATFPLDGVGMDLALAGDLLAGSHRGGRTFAMDLKSGAHWTTPPPAPPTGGLVTSSYVPEPVVIDDDAIFVTRADGVLYAFERSDGKERWSWPTHGSGALGVVHAPEFALYVGGTRNRVFVFKEGTRAPEQATIRGTALLDGKPMAGVEVIVEGKPLTTDTAGKFTTQLTSVGAVAVSVEKRVGKCLVSKSAIVDLEGKGTYDVLLDATSSWCKKP